jgi:hypothetical protein
MAKSAATISKSQILQLLESTRVEEQKEGWVHLFHAINGGRLTPDNKFTRRVFDCVGRSADPVVDESMFRAIEALCFAMWETQARAVDTDRIDAGAAGVEDLFLPPGALGSWLWRPFLKPSWVVRLVDARHRDERAAMTVARRLPYGVFAAAQFEEFRPKAFRFPLNVSESPGAVAFIGRPNLFFAPGESTERWKMSTARYGFDEGAKPTAWPDQRYHCIYEFIADVVPPVPHRATLIDNQLTDWGLVQRHVAMINGASVVVLVIAGSTFVGTYGAARWAAYSLFSNRLPATPIPAPEGIAFEAELEALVQVTATLDADTPKLPPLQMSPCDVRVDGRQWNPQTSRWEQPATRNVVLVRRKNRKAILTDIEEVWLDGRRAPLRNDHVAGRLLVAVCLTARQNQGVVTLDALSKSEVIWNRESRPDALAAHLRTLRQRYLGQSLQIGVEQCKLTAKVHLVT